MLLYNPTMKIQNSHADLLVNTVNTVGVMGAGLALDMKNAFPQIMPPYLDACKTGRLEPGTFQVLKVNDRQRVMNLATKAHWKAPSQPEWVGVGLLYMNAFLEKNSGKISTVAMPLPGGGLGGLAPERVHHMVRIYLHRALERGAQVEISCPEMALLQDQPFFAGIGARKTPGPVLQLMSEVGGLMAEAGIRLRSGGATGADSAFWNGAREVDPNGMEIFLPYKKAGLPDGIVHMSPVFERLALNFHPSPGSIRPNPENPRDKRHGILKLMARNGNQLFGTDFKNPTNVVICWTPGGRAGGGAPARQFAWQTRWASP